MVVVQLIFGAAGIAAGIWGKKFFKADILALGSYEERSSRWSGRLVFIIAGLWLVVSAISRLVWG